MNVEHFDMCFQIKQSAEILTNPNVTRNTCRLNQISEGQNGDVKIHTDYVWTMYGLITYQYHMNLMKPHHTHYPVAMETKSRTQT